MVTCDISQYDELLLYVVPKQQDIAIYFGKTTTGGSNINITMSYWSDFDGYPIYDGTTKTSIGVSMFHNSDGNGPRTSILLWPKIKRGIILTSADLHECAFELGSVPKSVKANHTTTSFNTYPRLEIYAR